MAQIRIEENSGFEDVCAWATNGVKKITFELLKKSSFQIFVEGVAVGLLRELVCKGVSINIKFYKNPDLVGLNMAQLHPILMSIFGLELLRVTEKIYNQDGVEWDVRRQLGERIWRSVLENRGVLGDGRRAYIISRHDYAVPKCIRQSEYSVEFPRYDYFKSSFSRLLVGLRGYSHKIGKHEAILIEWLHHIAENALEHGSKTSEGEIEGFRGISIGKIHFSREHQHVNVRGLPEFVRDYLDNILRSGRWPLKRITLNYASVIDLGEGLHNTVSGMDSLSDCERLKYVFKDGVTRKTDLMNEKSGYGLGQALIAAKALDAYMHIVSERLEVHVNFFGRGEQKTLRELLHCAPIDCNKKGSSVSILWLTESQIVEG